jgi:hypothetical protein
MFLIRGAQNGRLLPIDTAAINNPHKPRYGKPPHKDQHLLLLFLSRSKFMRYFVRFIVMALAAIYCVPGRGFCIATSRDLNGKYVLGHESRPLYQTYRLRNGRAYRRGSWPRLPILSVMCCRKEKCLIVCGGSVTVAMICYREMKVGQSSRANSSTQLSTDPSLMTCKLLFC